jgi:hypothetical protein
MHYDVKFGNTVVMTVDNIDSATNLAAALGEAAVDGFQVEGLSASVEECDRGSGVAIEAPEDPSDDEVYYALNADDAKAWIRQHEDTDDVESLMLVERSHPRFDGGRSGVLDDAEAYLEELSDGE